MQKFKNSLRYHLSSYKWYRKMCGGTWRYVVAYYEFFYWTDREPLPNETVLNIEYYEEDI